MNEGPPQDKSLESESVEKVRILLDTREEAIFLVKEFWSAMPHGKDVRFGEGEVEDWEQELTMGDRTRIVKGIVPRERGKWVVRFQGNHQTLSKEAVSWLSEKGLLNK